VTLTVIIVTIIPIILKDYIITIIPTSSIITATIRIFIILVVPELAI
jgi:hypothetical protein